MQQATKATALEGGYFTSLESALASALLRARSRRRAYWVFSVRVATGGRPAVLYHHLPDGPLAAACVDTEVGLVR